MVITVPRRPQRDTAGRRAAIPNFAQQAPSHWNCGQLVKAPCWRAGIRERVAVHEHVKNPQRSGNAGPGAPAHCSTGIGLELAGLAQRIVLFEVEIPDQPRPPAATYRWAGRVR